MSKHSNGFRTQEAFVRIKAWDDHDVEHHIDFAMNFDHDYWEIWKLAHDVESSIDDIDIWYDVVRLRIAEQALTDKIRVANETTGQQGPLKAPDSRGDDAAMANREGAPLFMSIQEIPCPSSSV